MHCTRDTFEAARARLERDVARTLGVARVDLVHAAVENLRGFQEQPDSEKLIADVQQIIHDTFINTTWPTCPRHGRHPLWYRDGRWWCTADDLAIADLGELTVSQL